MNSRQPTAAAPDHRTYDYEAFGLGFRSELPVPELRRSALEPAVTIKFARLGLTEPPDSEAGEWSRVESDAVYLGWKDVGTFRVSGGDEIAVDPDADVAPERLRLFLLGAGVGTLLHQRGYLVLHGSAVAIDGAAVAFLGSKWCGKSTIAAALHSRGHQLITDDVMAVDMGGATPLVQPGFPQLKLWPDSLSLIGADGSDIPRLHPDLEKRDFRVRSGFADRSLPLRCICVLDHGEQPEATALAADAVLPELIAHWYCGRFGYETLEGLGIGSHFVWSTRLAAAIPFYRLSRPRSLEAMSRVADIVEECVRNELVPQRPANSSVRKAESQAR